MQQDIDPGAAPLHHFLQEALEQYESLIERQPGGSQWRASIDQGSVVVEHRPDQPGVSGFVARLVHIARPGSAQGGYCILFLWGSLFEGAIGCRDEQLDLQHFFAKHLLDFAKVQQAETGKQDPRPPYWLLSPQALFGHEAGAQLPGGRLLAPEDLWPKFRPDVVVCIDVGAPSNQTVGWAVLFDAVRHTGQDLDELIQLLGPHLAAGRTIALGFECPLYVPRRSDPQRLTSQRSGEGPRSWSAGAGASVLSTGLVLVNWVLGRLRALAPDLRGTTRLPEFTSGSHRLFVWEAFVSRGVGRVVDLAEDANLNPHEADALRGALGFSRVAWRDDHFPSDLQPEPALSLIGMQLLDSGLSEDQSLLSQPCVVVQVRKPEVAPQVAV